MGYQSVEFPNDSVFLVTGGAGFIGSNLCEAILNLGYHVRCLDDLSTGKQANVDLFLGDSNYSFIKGDIKDLGIEDYYDKGGVTIIEWADMISDILPEERLDIKIKIIDENARTFVFEPHGQVYEDICEGVL